MKRIFPFVDNTWINYSNYLAWLDMNIESLKDYLSYFNPDYKILNEDLSYISSANWLEYTEKATSTHDNVFYDLSITNDGVPVKEVKICFLYQLKWREGIFNPYNNAYTCLDPSIIPYSGNIKYTITQDKFRNAISNNTIKPINISNTILSKKWTHRGIQDSDNSKEKLDWKNYIDIAKSKPNIYSVTTLNNNMIFEVIDSLNSSFISNYSFTLELLPNRYIISNENSKWVKGNNFISITGAIWNSPESQAIPKVYTKTHSIWTNNYPLLHELYVINNEGIHEQFFCDDLCSTNSVNIALHNTAEYVITMDTDNLDYTSNWNNVYVKII